MWHHLLLDIMFLYPKLPTVCFVSNDAIGVLQVLLCDDFRSSRRLLKSKAMQLSAMLLCLLVVTLTSRSALGLVDAGEYFLSQDTCAMRPPDLGVLISFPFLRVCLSLMILRRN
jgi:hypothetical protein